MYFKQFYLGCLAHASYLTGSEGEAAVVWIAIEEVDQAVDHADQPHAERFVGLVPLAVPVAVRYDHELVGRKIGAGH